MNMIFTIQFKTEKKPLIKVAGIALKDRVDLIFVMVPLEVVAKMITIIKIKLCVLFDTA